MTAFQIQLSVVSDGVATLSWSGATSPESLERAVRTATNEAVASGGPRRLEAAVPATDWSGRRALLRAGFRLEGVQRETLTGADGSRVDRWLFARLAADTVDGATGFSAVMNSALPRKRLIAHVLFTDDDGRLLLCDTRFKTDWELPGGIVEPLEAPRIGAQREVAEELGIDRVIGPLLVADWMPPYLGWEDAVELIFSGGRVSEADLATFTLQPSEIKQVRLCTLAEAAELVTPLSHRRLSIATGLNPGEFAYLEDGSPPRPAP